MALYSKGEENQERGKTKNKKITLTQKDGEGKQRSP